MNSPTRSAVLRNTGFSLCAVSQNGTHIVKLACRLGRPALPKSITHLFEASRGLQSRSCGTPRRHRRHQPPVFSITYGFSSRMPQKRPQCFLSLTDHVARKYLCFLSLTKKGEGGIANVENSPAETARRDILTAAIRLRMTKSKERERETPSALRH